MFSRISLIRLIKWILEEEKQGQILGIHKDLFFIPSKDDVFTITRYGQLLETPIGVAAGPHTQLAHNIVMAWLMGARYIELKTVQTLDEIDVSKPCIDMEDEGYNCEWSQELRLPDSFDEYLNAWIIIHILKDKFKWGDSTETGFIFNASVGYDMAGILQPNVQHFLDKLVNCNPELGEKIECIATFYPRIKDIDIPHQLTNNITLSTMHGCPQGEIEKICRYFIEERKFHTTLKLNPTLLGSEEVRYILNEKLGFAVQVPDEAFEHDISYPESVDLIQSLEAVARKHKVKFGLKLTNTLEVQNQKRTLPDSEEKIYLSGRALHPISILLANKLQNDFEGQLDISFCAGIDCFNVTDVLACGLQPVTTCSDLLKPGGYTRLRQYLEEIEKEITTNGSKSIDEFIMAKNGHTNKVLQAGWENLNQYAENVIKNKVYHKITFPYDNIKTSRSLTPFDCVQAPCMDACAIHQDIPQYMYYTSIGDYPKAYKVILDTNPLPNITGMVCDHLCQMKCTRMNYDNPLLIREIKRFVTENQQSDHIDKGIPKGELSVGIIGAGPSGLACAYFLAQRGIVVHVYEREGFGGGMVAGKIPPFRLQKESVANDLERIQNLGITFHYGINIDATMFRRLQRQHPYIYVAVGAQVSKTLGIPGETAEGVLDQLSFLSAVRRGESIPLGQKIAVIGGGNSAVDVARTAKRLSGEQGQVTVIYRRTIKEMPANLGDIQDLLQEGIELLELTLPEIIKTKEGRVTSLICSKMVLGEKDDSGRPSPEKVPNSQFELTFDTVISAIGQEVILDFIDEDLMVDPITNETSLEGVFAGGDFIRGASSVINAIRDGQHVSKNIINQILRDQQVDKPSIDRGLKPEDYQKKQAYRQYGIKAPQIGLEHRTNFDLVNLPLDEESARKEAARCLYCDDVCNMCISVCPNYANMAYTLNPIKLNIPEITKTESGSQIEMVDVYEVNQPHQVLNIVDFCNECGNCTTFCPTRGQPYLDKPRFALTLSSFKKITDGYFLQGNTITAKVNGIPETLKQSGDTLIYETKEAVVYFKKDGFIVTHVRFKSDEPKHITLRQAIEMYVLLTSLRDIPLFRCED